MSREELNQVQLCGHASAGENAKIILRKAEAIGEWDQEWVSRISKLPTFGQIAEGLNFYYEIEYNF